MASTLGGQLLYSPGTAAREVLLAAGVRVAAATHRPLVVIDDEAQHEDTAGFLATLGLDENAAHYLTPDQASRWLPQLGPQSVLAINREEDSAASLFVGREPGDRIASWETPVYWLRPAHEMNGTNSPLIVPAPTQPAATHDDGTSSLTRAAARLAAQHRPHGPATVPLPQSLRSNAPGIFGEDRFEAWAAQFAEIARQSQNRLAEAEATSQQRQDDLPDTPGHGSRNPPQLRQPGQQHDQDPHTGPAPGL
ncbi:hypothetical protein ACFV1U_14315 [Streptomyces microflavus]|uniref:hypothetical protein n=1 Tax=Streptomyces microflavus TaxID=1919 RepID=UPI0036C44114